MKVHVSGPDVGVSIGKEDIDDKFSKYGRINSIWVARQPPGFAFVEYDDARDGEDAIRDMNGRTILGCEIRVEESRSTRRGGNGAPGGGQDIKPGDWSCPKCHVNNFARRHECFRCGERKPDESDRGGSGYRDYGRGGDRDRDRDRGHDRDRDRYGPSGGRGRDRYDDRDRHDDRDRRDDRDRDRDRSRDRRSRRKSRSESRDRSRGREPSRERAREPSRERAREPSRERSRDRGKSRSESRGGSRDRRRRGDKDKEDLSPNGQEKEENGNGSSHDKNHDDDERDE